jgi:hypothetical protein
VGGAGVSSGFDWRGRWIFGRFGAESLRDLPAGAAKGGDDLLDADGVVNSFDVRDGEGGDGVSLGVEDGEADVDDAPDLVTGAALVAEFANPGEVSFEVGGLLPLCLLSPLLDGAAACVGGEVGEDDVAGGGTHEVDLGADLDVEAGGFGGVDLCEDDDVTAVEDAEMAGLAEFVGEPVHDRHGFSDHAFGGGMLLSEAEEAEGEVVAVLVGGLSEVAALLQAEEHAEYLGDGAVEAAGDLADVEPLGSSGEEFEDVQTLFKGRGGIVPLHFILSHGCPEERR